jgi:hypothetical protein
MFAQCLCDAACSAGLMQCTVLVCDSVLARWADILYLGAAASRGSRHKSGVRMLGWLIVGVVRWRCDWRNGLDLGVNRRVENAYSSLLWSALG